MSSDGPPPNQASQESGDDPIYAQTNVAVWVLTAASGAFLLVRIWCRHRYSKLWYDDGVLLLSWTILLVAAALLSRTISGGFETDDDKRSFFLFQNTSTSFTTIATAWTKVAFAITLVRIVRNRYLLYFLWAVIITANLILALGLISIWVPACEDPRAVLRPENYMCFDLIYLKYFGGTTIVYGGVIDVLLALFPWFIIRKLLLEPREKVGLTVAMSLGALNGAIVIFRAFYQLKRIDNDYYFMVFMSIFNFLEPGVTIIAQAIPMFRVLVVNVKRGSNAVRITSPTGVDGTSSGSAPVRSWGSRGPYNQHRKLVDEEMLPVHITNSEGPSAASSAGPAGSGSDVDLKCRENRSWLAG